MKFSVALMALTFGFAVTAAMTRLDPDRALAWAALAAVTCIGWMYVVYLARRSGDPVAAPVFADDGEEPEGEAV